jgi:hypothetical protein
MHSYATGASGPGVLDAPNALVDFPNPMNHPAPPFVEVLDE